MTRRRWDFESVKAEARRYSGITDFKYGSPGAYKWAVRHGLESDVMGFMSEITSASDLMSRIKGELGSAARDSKVCIDICKNVSDFYVPKEHDPEAVSAGTYLDFDAQMYDQSAEERSGRALDHIEALQKHGTPEQVREAWDLYLKFQTGRWSFGGGCDAGIDIPETEHGGSYDC